MNFGIKNRISFRDFPNFIWQVSDDKAIFPLSDFEYAVRKSANTWIWSKDLNISWISIPIFDDIKEFLNKRPKSTFEKENFIYRHLSLTEKRSRKREIEKQKIKKGRGKRQENKDRMMCKDKEK